MNLLAIDTSTEQISLALWLKGHMHTKTELAEKQHAKVLLLHIDDLFKEVGKSLNNLDAIVYGRGPGSFTGLRIACSVAKGLAYAKDLPLYPVSSLLAIKNEFSEQNPALKEKPLLSVIDARMQQLYWLYADNEEKVTDIDDINPIKESFYLAGVGFEVYLDKLCQKQNKLEEAFSIYPTAAAMIRLVLDGKIKSCSAKEALPVYVRNQVIQGVNRG